MKSSSSSCIHIYNYICAYMCICVCSPRCFYVVWWWCSRTSFIYLRFQDDRQKLYMFMFLKMMLKNIVFTCFVKMMLNQLKLFYCLWWSNNLCVYIVFECPLGLFWNSLDKSKSAHEKQPKQKAICVYV